MLIAGSSASLQAQAPIGQSAFSQYLATLTVGVGTVGVSTTTGDGGAAASATLEGPSSVAYDSAGNLYISDTTANNVREVYATGPLAGTIKTVAGSSVGTVGTAKATNGDGGPATSALLAAPTTVYVDSYGNIYIADSTTDHVREVYMGGPNNQFVTLVGTTQTAVTGVVGNIYTIVGSTIISIGSDGLTGPNTPISNPTGVWVDAIGNVDFCDNGANHVIMRAVSISTQLVETLAGSKTTGSTGDGGPALSSEFTPRYCSVDSRGNYIVTDKTHDEVRIVPVGNAVGGASTYPVPAGAENYIYDLAGITGMTTATGAYTGDGSLAPTASLNAPNQAVNDIFGNTFIADQTNNVFRVVDKNSGLISTLGYLNGTSIATTGLLVAPQGIAFGPNGQFAIADLTNHVVRLGNLNNNFAATNLGTPSAPTNFTFLESVPDTITVPKSTTADFTLGTITGSASCVTGGGAPQNNTCNLPVTFTPQAAGLRIGQIVTTDLSGYQSILPLTGVGVGPGALISPGLIETIAGKAGTAGNPVNGASALSSLLSAPAGIARDSVGNIYVSLADNTVREISATTGNISTVAGTSGTAGYTGDGGTATLATLSGPTALAVDPSGNLFITDTGNNAVREVSASGGKLGAVGVINTVTYFQQTATLGTQQSILRSPKGIAVDMIGNLYIADTGNNLVRKITRGGGYYTIVAGLAGGAAVCSSATAKDSIGDGCLATQATLNAPGAVTVDYSGNVYIADTGNNVIREVAAGTGIITTIVGTESPGTATGTNGDGGLASAATLNAPGRVQVDAFGDLYITDTGDNKIRFVSVATSTSGIAGGTISTIAGSGAATFADNVNAPNGTLNAPAAMVVDHLSNIYIADTANNRIAEVLAAGGTFALGGAQAHAASSVAYIPITNFGTGPLTVTGATFSSTAFALAPNAAGDCRFTPTAAGQTCQLGIIFTPPAVGPFSGTATISDNAPGSPQTITLTATGSLPPSAITFVSGAPQTTTPYGAFGANLVAKVTDANGSAVSNVTVTFADPTTGATGIFCTPTVQTSASGLASTCMTANGTDGTFTATASVSGVTTPASFPNETIAGLPSPTVTLSYAPTTNPIVYGNQITISVKVTAPGGLTTIPQGTVAISDNGVAIPAATAVALNASGVATYGPFTPTAISHSYTATYSGNTSYSPATTTAAATLSVTKLAITAAATSVSMFYGTTPPTIMGTLTGVLPADVANVVPTFLGYTSATSGTPIGSGTPVILSATQGPAYPIETTLSGSAAANYTVTSTTGTVTIVPDTTMGVITYTPLSAGPQSTVVLTDIVTSKITNAPAVPGPYPTTQTSESVTYTDVGPSGTVSLGTVAGATGTFVLNTGLAVGTHTITACYTAVDDFAASCSAAVTITIVNPGLVLTPSVTSVTVIQGSVAVYPFTATGIGGLATTTYFSCTGNPANSTCVPTGASLVPNATLTPTPFIMSVQTTGPGTMAELKKPSMGAKRELMVAGLASLPCLALLMLGFRRNKKSRRKLAAQALMIVLAAVGILSASGCGGSVLQNPALTSQETPVGTYTVTVIGTASTITTSFNVTLNVIAKPSFSSF